MNEQKPPNAIDLDDKLTETLGCLQRVYWFLSDPHAWPWTAQDMLDDVAEAIGAKPTPVHQDLQAVKPTPSVQHQPGDYSTVAPRHEAQLPVTLPFRLAADPTTAQEG